MSGFRCLALGLATAAAIASTGVPAPAQEMTIRHAQGEVVLPAPPEKVLVLDVNSLDIAAALGAEPYGVLGSNLPGYLSEFAGDEFLKVGSLFEPDFEAINAADAGLMVIGGRSRAKHPELSAMLPTIDLSVDPEGFTESVKANVVTLGEIFSRQEKAAELNATLDGKIAALRDAAKGAGTALILVTNAGKLGAYGPSSRVGWLHTEIGFAPVEEGIDDRFHGGDIVSFEYVLEKDPDWLLVIARDAGIGRSTPENAAAAVLDNELMAQTSAMRNGQVVYLDPAAAYIVSGGYTGVSTLIDQLNAAMAGKLPM